MFLIYCISIALETTLNISDQVTGFQEPGQSCIGHPFHGFTHTSSQCDWLIIGRVSVNLSGLRDRDNCRFPQEGGNDTVSHTLLNISTPIWQMLQQLVVNVIWTNCNIMCFIEGGL